MIAPCKTPTETPTIAFDVDSAVSAATRILHIAQLVVQQLTVHNMSAGSLIDHHYQSCTPLPTNLGAVHPWSTLDLPMSQVLVWIRQSA